MSRALAASIVVFSFATAPAMADDLDKIRENGTLTVALSGAFPPFSMVNEANQVVGFDVDIANEMAKRLGVKPEIITTAWDGIIAGLVTGRYNTVIGSMGMTDERKKAVDFIGPYYRSGLGLFVRDGADYNDFAALSGKTVGVTLGETSEQWLRKQPGYTVRTYRGLPELLLDLRAGRIDAAVADDVPVLLAIKEGTMPIHQISDETLPRFDIGIAVRKGNPELVAAMEKALADMMADGTYEEISMRWVGADIR